MAMKRLGGSDSYTIKVILVLAACLLVVAELSSSLSVLPNNDKLVESKDCSNSEEEVCRKQNKACTVAAKTGTLCIEYEELENVRSGPNDNEEYRIGLRDQISDKQEGKKGDPSGAGTFRDQKKESHESLNLVTSLASTTQQDRILRSVDEPQESCNLEVCIAVDKSGAVCNPDPTSSGLCINCDCLPESDRIQDYCCNKYLYTTTFVATFAGRVRSAVLNAKISAVSFSTEASEVSLGDLGIGIYDGAYTNTGGAIGACRQTFSSLSATKQVLVLFTFGLPSVTKTGRTGLSSEEYVQMGAQEYAREQADFAKQEGVIVIPVGIGVGIDTGFLGSISSPGSSIFTYSPKDLSSILDPLVEATVCGEGNAIQ